MKSNTLKIIINKPVNDVFEFTINPNNTDKWCEGAGREWTNEWPCKLGTIYENNNGFLTVTEFEINKLFTLTKQDEFFVRYTYKATSENITEMIYYEESLNNKLLSITDISVMQKLKEVLENS